MRRDGNKLDIYIEDLTPEVRQAVESIYGFENESADSLKRLSRAKPIVSIPLDPIIG